MTEYIVRFFVGGIVVSAFAMLGEMLRPKSFAGLFAAAPSVALATLGIAIYQHGAAYAGSQAVSMMAGAVALAVYSIVVCQLLIRTELGAASATLLSLIAWLSVAFGVLALARKREAGLVGSRRGREAAALDAAGAGLGSIGMLAFAVVFSMLVEGSVTVAFVSASVAWLVVSVAAWFVRRKLRFVRRPRMGEGTHSSTMSRSHSG